MSNKVRSLKPEVRNARPAAVDLHIDELVLEGFPFVDRSQLKAAVQRELAKLVSERGAPQGLSHASDIASVDAGEFHMGPDANAQAIGSQIAQAVYGGLNR